MADATTPVLIHPRSTLSTNLAEMQTLTYRKKMKILGTAGAIAAELEEGFVDDVEVYKDEDATVDTATTPAGNFFIEMTAEITTLVQLLNFECLGLDVGFVPYKISEYYVFTGTIASGPLQRWEVLTFDDSGATLTLEYGANLADGASRVIVGRLTSGTISAADAVLTGGTSSGTLTITAGTANQAGGANNRCPGIGGRLKVPSTGAAHANQTGVAVSYVAEGTKAS
jgi:hypothetical protein